MEGERVRRGGEKYLQRLEGGGHMHDIFEIDLVHLQALQHQATDRKGKVVHSLPRPREVRERTQMGALHHQRTARRCARRVEDLEGEGSERGEMGEI